MQCDAVRCRAAGKLGQKRPRVVLEHAARPAQAVARPLVAALVAELADGDQIMVAGHALAGQGARATNTLVGRRPIADEVTRTEIGVDLLCGEERERGLEGVHVGVDIRDDAEAHHAAAAVGARRWYQPAQARDVACHSVPLMNGSGSSGASPETARQRPAQRSHASGDMPDS